MPGQIFDPAAALISAYHTGASIAQSRSALEQQARIASMEMMERAEQNRQKAIQTQQQLATERAYQNIQTSIRQGHLDLAEQEANQRAQVAGRLLMAKQRANARTAELMGQGMNRDEAMKQSFQENWAEIGMTSGQLASMNRQAKDTTPSELTTKQIGGQTYYYTGNHWTHVPAGSSQTIESPEMKDRVSAVRRDLVDAQKKSNSWVDAGTDESRQEKAKLDSNVTGLMTYLNELHKRSVSPPAAQAPAPSPLSQSSGSAPPAQDLSVPPTAAPTPASSAVPGVVATYDPKTKRFILASKPKSDETDEEETSDGSED